ncbi:MAG: hypothetical protein KatS3mg090_0071 [Patescibacteria group bacterium]|nr:MAG: hypothetical protein KatS3mg090_0071 [Patescibacteria group bacterium]
MLFFKLFKKGKTVFIDDLIRESKIDFDYLFMLGVSTVIVTLGFVVGEIAIVIGGMIIAPFLFPLLALSLGVVTLSLKAVIRAMYGILISVLWVIVLSYATTFFLEDVQFRGSGFLFSIKPNVLTFLVAFLSGLSASYSSIAPHLSMVLPGVAVAVSLVPPLVAVGIFLHLSDKVMFLNALLVFALNALGIILSGIIVYFFSGLRSLQNYQEQVIQEEKNE